MNRDQLIELAARTLHEQGGAGDWNNTYELLQTTYIEYVTPIVDAILDAIITELAKDTP